MPRVTILKLKGKPVFSKLFFKLAPCNLTFLSVREASREAGFTAIKINERLIGVRAPPWAMAGVFDKVIYSRAQAGW